MRRRGHVIVAVQKGRTTTYQPGSSGSPGKRPRSNILTWGYQSPLSTRVNAFGLGKARSKVKTLSLRSKTLPSGSSRGLGSRQFTSGQNVAPNLMYGPGFLRVTQRRDRYTHASYYRHTRAYDLRETWDM